MFHIDGIKMGWASYFFIFQPLLWSSLFFSSMPIGFNKRGISSRSILGHWDAAAGPWWTPRIQHLFHDKSYRKSMVNPHFKCHFLRWILLGNTLTYNSYQNSYHHYLWVLFLRWSWYEWIVKWWILSLPGCAAKSLFCFVIFVTPLKRWINVFLQWIMFKWIKYCQIKLFWLITYNNMFMCETCQISTNICPNWFQTIRSVGYNML